MGTSPKNENRLSAESSPYLLQHAENPVDWFPWGEDAIDLAREALQRQKGLHGRLTAQRGYLRRNLPIDTD